MLVEDEKEIHTDTNFTQQKIANDIFSQDNFNNSKILSNESNNQKYTNPNGNKKSKWSFYITSPEIDNQIFKTDKHKNVNASDKEEFENLLSVVKNKFGEKHFEVAKLQIEFAEKFRELGNVKKQIKLLESALEILKIDFNKDYSMKYSQQIIKDLNEAKAMLDALNMSSKGSIKIEYAN